MAKYKKRADGRYATSVIVGYKDDGKPKRKVIYGKTIMELDKKVADFKSLQNKGIVINDEGLTVKQWAKQWLKTYKTDKEYNTYEMYRSKIDTYIVPAIGNIRLNALKTHNIQELLNSIIRDGHKRTAELVYLTISQFIKQAIIEEYIYKDITLGLALPKKDKTTKRALSDEEKEFIQKANFNEKEQVFTSILYYTGLRRGEALALMVNDINLKQKTIKITKTLVLKDNNESFIKPSPKSNAGNREIPIPNALFDVLKKYMSNLDSLFLFTQADGQIMSRSAFRRFWDDIMDKINIAAGGTKYRRKETQSKKGKKNKKVHIQVISNDITPHIFRHTYATNLYYAGVDVKTAQYLLGHSNIQITLEIYTHLDNSKIQSAANVLDEYFSKKV